MKKLIVIGGLLYVVAFAAVWTFRHSFIYRFDATEVSPKDAGEARLQAIRFNSFDGTSLVVWVKRAKRGKPTVFYFHGNAGNLAGRAERFDRLVDRGYGVVAMAYRGSSGSAGAPTETLINKDVLFLRQNVGQILKSAPKGKIVYYGESLGTGVAVKLAANIAPDAVVLEAPYRSVVKLAAKQMPIFPINTFLDERWDTEKHIKHVTAPLLIVHGDQDTIIPVEHGKALFIAANEPKKIKVLKGAQHHNMWSVAGQTAIYDFIDGLK